MGFFFFGDAGADASSRGVLFSELKKKCVAFVHNQKIHDNESLEIIDREFDNIIETLDKQATLYSYTAFNKEQ